jgi:DNA-binding response OmpR family regulator
MDRPLTGCSILIVEDEPLTSLDIETAFERAGARVLVSRTLQQALTRVEDYQISAAILDRRLRDGDSSCLCDRFQQRGIPFVIYSGLSDSEGAWRHVPHVSKPANPDVLVTTVVGLLRNQPRVN